MIQQTSRFPVRSAVALLLLSASLLTACRSGPATCAKPGVYADAKTVAPLRVPAGLDAPDTRGALKVPDLNEPEQPTPKVAPCLDQPPKFSNSARLEPSQAERDLSKGKRSKKATPPPAPPAAPATPAPAPAP
ncbi:MAG: hypothetical protein ABW136_11910 [Steroidobacteraceae bacterium]